MKKRNLLVVLVLSVLMLFAGCAKEEEVNPFLGTWNGTLDYTQSFTDMMVAENADIEKFVKFENLTFTFAFTFTEEKLSMHVDEASKLSFVQNVEAGIASMIDAMAEDEATKNGITVEEVYAGMGVTRDAYVQATIENMQINAMVDAMAGALELNGAYEYDDSQIVILYDDNTYEEMKYVLGIEDLTITITDGTNSFVIPCTKEN